MGLNDVIVRLLGTSVGASAITLILFVGAVQGLKSLLRFINGIYIYFLRPGKDLKKLGEWAVVTGATDGIGLAYAKQLAKLGACCAVSLQIAHCHILFYERLVTVGTSRLLDVNRSAVGNECPQITMLPLALRYWV